jgi:hypothetical protein
VDESAEQIATAQTVGRYVQRCRVAAVGREQLKGAMRPMFVVVTAVDAEYLLEVVVAEDERIRSRQSERAVRTQRSAKAFAFGAWKGLRISPSSS